MRKSKARQAIIDKAAKLIEKKGYSNLNVNELAYAAKVSVGTLYHHFPKGKIDILAEVMSQRTEWFVSEFNLQLGVEKLLEKGRSLDENLRWIFKKVIELRRHDQQFLLALQIELLSNPKEYNEFVKRYQITDGLQQAMGVLSEVLMKSAKSEIAGLDATRENVDRIQRVVGLLMTYQIIFPHYFGDDDEFVDLASRVFFEILKS